MQATERTKPTILDLPDQARQATAHDLLRTDKDSWLYFLTMGDEVVYVGETVQLRSRITAHMATKDFDGVFVATVSGHARKSIEAKWILRLRPRFNRVGKNPKSKSDGCGLRGPKVGPDGPAIPLCVSVPEKICEAVDRRAKSAGLTRSAAVTAALREWLAT